MPNGTGKTTTLTLLRAALSGAARNWDPSEIRELRKKGSDQDSGRFELQLLLDGRPLTVVMEFSLDTGDVQYKTTWGDGQKAGFQPPSTLLRFMNESFVNFFVFDGELAERLLARDHTHAEEAVESLFQVNRLRQMQDRIDAYWDDQTRNVTSKDQAGHTRRTNLLARWRQRLQDLEAAKQALERGVSDTEGDIKTAESRYRGEIRKDEERESALRTAEKDVETLGDQVSRRSVSLLDGMRDPHGLALGFARSIFAIKNGLDHAKLPQSAAREFFEDLAGEPECVCGRPIDESIRPVIRERAQLYLGADEVGVLNAMKTGIADAVGDSLTEAASAVSTKVDSLTRDVRAFNDAKNVLHELRQRVHSDEDVHRYAEELDRLKELRRDAKKALLRFEGEDETLNLDRVHKVDETRIFAIKTVEQVIEELKRQVEEATMTLGLGRKRDVLKAIVMAAQDAAQKAIKSEICEETNQRIADLMPHNDIRIDRIDGCLYLRGQSKGSIGETLSVGYAFLSTLFDRAEHHHLPFVVDSPANAIDLDIRPKIGDLVPRLTGQFIAFVISSERDRFVPSLVKAAGQSVQFITLFRKGISTHEKKGKLNPGCKETEDGLLVHDEEFFNEFQLDAE